jgi:uncharacterized protein YndB with AHSA1/START domain
MPVNEYRFRSVWSIAAPQHEVFHALVDLAGYPDWWPDVRSVSEVDEDTAEVVCKAVLPYRLRLRMRRTEQDETNGRLRVDLTGDLVGYLGCRLDADRGRTRLKIVQEVVVTRRLLRVMAPLARPLLVANHGAMMWRGQRGLRKHLATAPLPVAE